MMTRKKAGRITQPALFFLFTYVSIQRPHQPVFRSSRISTLQSQEIFSLPRRTPYGNISRCPSQVLQELYMRLGMMLCGDSSPRFRIFDIGPKLETDIKTNKQPKCFPLFRLSRTICRLTPESFRVYNQRRKGKGVFE